MSVLALTNSVRNGGGGRTERAFLDFVVDGVALAVRLRALGFDLTTPMVVGDPMANSAYRERLLGRTPPDLPDGRTALYVCPECGDLACGAISARIDVGEHTVVWSDFGHENTYDPEIQRDGVREWGPFEFRRSEYERVLGAADSVGRLERI